MKTKRQPTGCPISQAIGVSDEEAAAILSKVKGLSWQSPSVFVRPNDIEICSNDLSLRVQYDRHEKIWGPVWGETMWKLYSALDDLERWAVRIDVAMRKASAAPAQKRKQLYREQTKRIRRYTVARQRLYHVVAEIQEGGR